MLLDSELMMLKELSTAMNRQPFRPFTIISLRRWFKIDSPESVRIERDGEIIRIHATDGKEYIIEIDLVYAVVDDTWTKGCRDRRGRRGWD